MRVARFPKPVERVEVGRECRLSWGLALSQIIAQKGRLSTVGRWASWCLK